MIDAKHTPGPWNLDDGEIDAGGFVIASVHGAEEGAVFGCLDDDGDINKAIAECRANARLIAAAPDLLAACEKAMLACQDNLKMYAYKNEPSLLEAFDACKAAIARATA